MVTSGDATFGYRLRNGKTAAAWRITTRDGSEVEFATTRELAEHGITPITGPELRQLIEGHRLTMLKRSDGELYEIEFGPDGQSRLWDSTGKHLGERHYSVFQNQLVMEIEDRASYVSVFHTPLGFLAARSIDDGAVDWELLSRE